MYASDSQNSRTKYAWGNELAWLRNTARDLQYAVMIGAGPAVMGMALMEGNPHLNLVIIDKETIHYARSHLDAAGFPHVGYVVDDSAEYGKDYAGPKLDFLLVDGDHSKAGVMRDVKSWFRHIRPGGILFFHAYENVNDDLNNGVKEALTELLNSGILKVEELSRPGISIVYGKL